jgi:hypothetical protein
MAIPGWSEGVKKPTIVTAETQRTQKAETWNWKVAGLLSRFQFLLPS